MSEYKFPIPSPSGLLEFEQCPAKWRDSKVLKLHKFTVTEAISHGLVTHERLERYVKYADPLPDHVLYLLPFFAYLTDTKYQVFAELECAVLADWSVTGWWDKQCYIRGKVDLIAISQDGTEAVVVDYKSGNRKNDPTQLKIYALMIASVLGIKKVKSYYLWTKTKDSDVFELDEANFDEVKTEIEERVAKMRLAFDTNEYPTRTSPLCGWCQSLDKCDAAAYYREKKARGNR